MYDFYCTSEGYPVTLRRPDGSLEFIHKDGEPFLVRVYKQITKLEEEIRGN